MSKKITTCQNFSVYSKGFTIDLEVIWFSGLDKIQIYFCSVFFSHTRDIICWWKVFEGITNGSVFAIHTILAFHFCLCIIKIPTSITYFRFHYLRHSLVFFLSKGYYRRSKPTVTRKERPRWFVLIRKTAFCINAVLYWQQAE